MLNSNSIVKKLLLEQDINLRDIQGEFLLSGVGFGVVHSENVFESDDANTMTIILDDIPFTFVEDPDDGYRSTLDRVFIGGWVDTTFPPIVVRVEYDENSQYGEFDNNQLLYGFDIKLHDKKPCFIVGTDNTDDYYPMYIANWNPENLHTNHISS